MTQGDAFGVSFLFLLCHIFGDAGGYYERVL
jgi:hypothetical protein